MISLKGTIKVGCVCVCVGGEGYYLCAMCVCVGGKGCYLCAMCVCVHMLLYL